MTDKEIRFNEFVNAYRLKHGRCKNPPLKLLRENGFIFKKPKAPPEPPPKK